ncbi:MrdA [Desulfamplus magnetovallimortis]|uniref:MrdA n=1 Tax=Desulfamplus magnetovallimortis TaxID=1246637 RepID=A0A1W1H978_9BACT|nr:penicillin-binding protein 2 [Desulfamplus magnetovallimortis]SLM28965.1 MrdA [Desulfamplus magnetovallimortis]
MKSPDRDWLKKRLGIAAVFIMVVFSLLLTRFVYLQVVEGEEYRRLSENNCIRLQSVPASRGMIYDRTGTLLVDNRPSFDLKIVLKDAVPLHKTLEKLSVFTAIPLDEILQKVEAARKSSIYKPVLLKKNITRNQLAVVEAHGFDLPGVLVDVEPRRNYIYKKSAAHVIGYLGEINEQELVSGRYPDVRAGDSIGRYGAEKSYEDILRGKRGGRQIEVDARGRLVRVLSTVDSIPGKNIYLTIDSTLQQTSEALLEGKVGAVVAVEPSCGDILAMASSPSFDLNDFIGGISIEKWKNLIENSDRPMSNKAIQGEYPPASTYKMVTAIAALEEGVVDRHTTRFCPGHYKYGNRVYRCWKKWGHGKVNVLGAIENSCDVFFYRAGEDLGVDTLAQYATGCGLGRLTHIDLANERAGLVPTSAWKKRRFGKPWQGGETLSIAIGQGFNLVTPLQMAVFVAAIGNGGTLYRPRILKYTQTYSGKEEMKSQPPEILGGLPASQDTLGIIRKGMFNVVEGDRGTAHRIRIKGIQMAGKTGTAQVFSLKKSDRESNRRLDYHLRDHAWFVCYAPAENPVIAVSVIIEHGEHGSTAAAPVAGEIVREWLEIQGMMPSVPQ